MSEKTRAILTYSVESLTVADIVVVDERRFCKLMAVFAVAFLIAGRASSAELWEGRWSDSADPQTCIAEPGDGSPLVVMSREVTPGGYVQIGPDGVDQEPKGDAGQITFEREADPWVCYIDKITGVRQLEAWIFDLQCGGEGEIWRDRAIVMRTTNPKGIAAYNLGVDPLGGVRQLYRCG